MVELRQFYSNVLDRELGFSLSEPNIGRGNCSRSTGAFRGFRSTHGRVVQGVGHLGHNEAMEA